MAQTNEIIYRDIDNKFTKHPVTKKLQALTNNDAVKRAVRNIVLTDKMERPYHPELGSNIRKRLFENMDEITEFAIKKDIEECLSNYEPRAELIDVIVNASPDDNGISMNIIFRVTNQADPVQINLILDRVR